MPRLKLREVAEAALESDPKTALLESLGDLSGIEAFHNNVIVATYIEPPKIMKGPKGEPIVFHKTDKGHLEDRFQGKCFLILKMGPLAFKDDHIAKFGGIEVHEGDWVIARPSDGSEFFMVDTAGAGTSCRMFEDTSIKGRISDPSLIY